MSSSLVEATDLGLNGRTALQQGKSWEERHKLTKCIINQLFSLPIQKFRQNIWQIMLSPMHKFRFKPRNQETIRIPQKAQPVIWQRLNQARIESIIAKLLKPISGGR